ncbi:hypothetical protein EVAR_24244_1 [Eumeta japonica]|uniref:Uncharacterized protein n=1 Tax=Eumeta variegata TaxID=151549 RepID=A0A4C1W579_EUMVA|nr:hypothetical protein EVAR_24244_1 [Eumeta japonica]
MSYDTGRRSDNYSAFSTRRTKAERKFKYNDRIPKIRSKQNYMWAGVAWAHGGVRRSLGSMSPFTNVSLRGKKSCRGTRNHTGMYVRGPAVATSPRPRRASQRTLLCRDMRGPYDHLGADRPPGLSAAPVCF